MESNPGYLLLNLFCFINLDLCQSGFVSMRICVNPDLHQSGFFHQGSFRRILPNEQNQDIPPVYLHLIFEISSVTQFFFNFEISSLKNQKINLISKLISAGYTGSKNQVRTWQKIKFVPKSFFFFKSKHNVEQKRWTVGNL